MWVRLPPPVLFIMKKCRTCKLEKDEIHFTKKARNSDGLNSECKTCSRARVKQHYNDNKQYYLDKKKKQEKKNRKVFKEYKNTLQCSKCGQNHPATLEFHHPDKNKEYNIANKVKSLKFETLLKEIEKCTVLCSNCHRILHYEEREKYGR